MKAADPSAGGRKRGGAKSKLAFRYRPGAKSPAHFAIWRWIDERLPKR